MTIRGLEDRRKPALVISECQNGIVGTQARGAASPGEGRRDLSYYVHERGIIPKIDHLAGEFRKRSLPVVHCTISLPKDMVGFPVNCLLAGSLVKRGTLLKGSWEASVHEDIHVAESDFVSERMHGMSPFTGTELDMMLRGNGVETVVLVGVSTNIALPGAATEAVNLGYNVVLVEDCTAGGTPETHQMQVTMHLPFLATVTDSASVVEAIRSAE